MRNYRPQERPKSLLDGHVSDDPRGMCGVHNRTNGLVSTFTDFGNDGSQQRVEILFPHPDGRSRTTIRVLEGPFP